MRQFKTGFILLIVLSMLGMLMGCDQVKDTYNKVKENDKVQFVMQKVGEFKDAVVENNPFKKEERPPSMVRPPVVIPEEDLAKGRPILTFAALADQTGTTKGLIDKLNAENQSFYVDLQEYAFTDSAYYNLISYSKLGTGTDFDLFELDLTWCAEFAEKGYLLELDSAAVNIGISPNSYVGIEGARYNGKLWGIPREITLDVLFFRNDLSDHPPSSWSDLTALANNAKGSGLVDQGILFAGEVSDNLVFQTLSLMYSYGGRVLDGEGNIVVNSNQNKAAFEKLRELYQLDGNKQALFTLNRGEAASAFANQKVLFMRNKPEYWNTMEGSALRAAFSIAPLPHNGPSGVDLIGGQLVCISPYSEKQDLALEFLKILTGNEAQKQLALSGKVPALKIVMQDADVNAKYPLFQTDAFRKLISNAVMPPSTVKYALFSYRFQEEVSKYLYYDLETDVLMSNLEKSLTELFKK